MRVTAVYWLVLFLLLTQIISISSLFYMQIMAR